MSTEYWVLIVIGALMLVALGFLAGRASAPRQRRLAEMERERDQARDEAGRVEEEVTRHFEQSARMFGRLADDYRSFFEHFAQTAQNLGLSEGRARELLQRADPRLVADQSGAAADTPAQRTEEMPAEEAPAGAAREASDQGTAAAPDSAAQETRAGDPAEGDGDRRD